MSIITDYREAKSLSLVAELHGMAKSTLRRKLIAAGVELQPAKGVTGCRKPIEAERVEAMLKQGGLTYRKIALACGVSRSFVKMRAGLTRDKR